MRLDARAISCVAWLWPRPSSPALGGGSASGRSPPAGGRRPTDGPRPIDDREIDPVAARLRGGEPPHQPAPAPPLLRLRPHPPLLAAARRGRPSATSWATSSASTRGRKVGLGLRFGLFAAGTEISRLPHQRPRHPARREAGPASSRADKPLSLGLQAAVEGRDNFGEQLLARAGRRSPRGSSAQRATLYADPRLRLATSATDPGVADDDALPPRPGRTPAAGPRGGPAGRVDAPPGGLRPPRPRSTPGRSAAQPLTFGLEKRVGGHAFQLNFSNGFGTTYTALARGASRERLVHRLQPVEEVLLAGC